MLSFYKSYKEIMREAADPSAASTSSTRKINFKSNPTLINNLIKAIRAWLKIENPIFSDYLENMKMVMTNDVSTMAVDNKRNIYINPDFVLELCEGYVKFRVDNQTREVLDFKFTTENNPLLFVICHEIYHIFNETFAREKGRRHVLMYNNRPIDLWNIATDIEMNHELQHSFKITPAVQGLITNPDGSIYISYLNRVFSIADSRAEVIYRQMLEAAKEIEELQKTYPPYSPVKDPVSSTKKPTYKVGDRIYKEEPGAGITKPLEWYEVKEVKPNGEPIVEKLPLMPSAWIKVKLAPPPKNK